MPRPFQALRITSLFIALFLPAAAFSVESDTGIEQEKRLVTVDDQFAIKSVGSPVFSPDGKHIAYTVSTNDYAKNSSSTRIWLIPSEGGAAVPMTSAFFSSRQPVFSKDGKNLYFLSSRHEQKSQLWSLNLESGGEAQQVTKLEQGVNQINFSSDEKKLLLVIKDKDDSEPLVEGSKPAVVDRLQFKADYVGYLDRLRRHIYIYDIASKQLEQITTGDFDDSGPAWSPDDSQVAFSSNRNPGADYNSDIWLVDAKPGAEPRKLTSNTGADSSPFWHPGGEWLVYLSKKHDVPGNYANQNLARINVTAPDAEFLSPSLDRNVYDARFSEDGKYIYFRVEDSGEQHVSRLRWPDGSVERMVSGKFVVRGFALSRNDQIAGIISSSLRPGELFVQEGEDTRIITGENDELVNQLHLAKTEEIHFQAPDGWPIEGFITFPPDYEQGKSYPAILKIHGGPVSQYAHGFSFDAQFLAANGYLVIRSNPRGSSGYGEDFAMGLYLGWGEKDYQDVLAAVDYAIEQGYADEDRLGVGGYSYGGILTNYLLGHTTRFKAAVSGAGSGHYLASYGHDEYQHWYESELGLPWENREPWERLSPFNYIHKATTPTMFIGGDADWNVPIQGSEQLYQVMKRVGIETQLVVYSGEHHGGWAFANQKDSDLRSLAWFGRFLAPEKSE